VNGGGVPEQIAVGGTKNDYKTNLRYFIDMN
jgi:hypothetical protein